MGSGLTVTEPVANKPIRATGTSQNRRQQHMLSLFSQPQYCSKLINNILPIQEGSKSL
jgi:hypothetical protein